MNGLLINIIAWEGWEKLCVIKSNINIGFIPLKIVKIATAILAMLKDPTAFIIFLGFLLNYW